MKRNMLIALIIVLLLGASYLVWKAWFEDALHQYANLSRDAVVISPDIDGSVVESAVYLPQNWSPSESIDFYTRPQGSLLMPYDWFLHLEQPTSKKLFRADENVNRLRYLPQRRISVLNPDGLPVGFVKDRRRDGQAWLGLTCAACHTGEIHYNGVAYRIDGGPAQADVQTMLDELTRAMVATKESPDKFARFAQALEKTSPSQRDSLRVALDEQAKFRIAYDKRNHSNLRYGNARLDAFGRILNETTTRHVKALQEPGNPPDAPVSFPFLWDAPHHDWVQWNGAANNRLVPDIPEIGALARNTGEMLGVFGEVDCDTTDRPGFDSSIRLHNLLHLEHLVKDLWSPLWKDAKTLPALDNDRVKRGSGLFDKHCAECHDGKGQGKNRTDKKFVREDPDREIRAALVSQTKVKTDDRMVQNFKSFKGSTGHLEGRAIGLKGLLEGNNFGSTSLGGPVLVYVVQQTIRGGITDPRFRAPDPVRERDLYWYAKRRALIHDLSLAKLAEHFDDISWGAFYPGFKKDSAVDLLVYKARPLNGIWATAPYLHNGSVPSLAQLLLPAKERVKEFYVGSREFDPENVGFKIDAFDGGFRFQTRDADGKLIPGNSNEGHEYGVTLSAEERRDLLEYLKSL